MLPGDRGGLRQRIPVGPARPPRGGRRPRLASRASLRAGYMPGRSPGRVRVVIVALVAMPPRPRGADTDDRSRDAR